MAPTAALRPSSTGLDTLRPRLPAFLTHLAISGIIFVALMAMIVFVWYPGPFFAYDGGWRGTLIVVAVDLVLGPVLTLVVYDPRKARWKTVMDLTCIGLLQAGALTWGVYVVESQRPVAASYFENAFHSVTAERIRAQGGDTGRVSGLGGGSPPLVHVGLPGDARGRAEMTRLLREGFLPPVQAQLFEPLAPRHAAELRRATAVVERLARTSPELTAEIESFFQESTDLPRERAFLVPFYGRYGSVIFVLDEGFRRRGVLESGLDELLGTGSRSGPA